MDGFDGELHLRLLGERLLLSGASQDPLGDPLTGQARALAAVGAVARPVAQRVVDDYARARALRGQGGPAQSGPPPSAAPLPARRIAPGRRVIRQPTGDLEIRYAILGPTETRLAITFRSNARVSPDVARRPAGMPIGITTVPSISVTDDRGTTVTSSAFSGGGTALQWRGFLTLRPALAPDTGWIELYGERVVLGPDASDRAVTIDHLAEADAVERYLAQCLAVDSAQPRPRAMAHALGALRAAGLVDGADPAIAAIAAVYNALIPQSGPYLLPATLAAGHWRSLLARRGTTGGPRRALFVGATTPVFDGIRATLLDLTSTDDRFQCDFEIAGPIELGMAGDASLGRTVVTSGALDDLGNFYLGQPGTWGWGGGDGSTFSGTLDFWPALDPAATRLDLILTTDRARVTIAVPLTWDAAP
ncbi:hypothetical protein [Pseudofrankia sp. DC12]|uniref:hypothetical protein n=1 Tax=Pseudofrankia sp. DC12 TaxID=683315 RepID=UPI0005F80505|nr:hypothetical protein [Pseudofrankia sp. DC12]